MTETILTNAAHEALKETIRQTYPQGSFVAIADGRIVAASADFGRLKELVRAEGMDPRSVLVVRAGVDLPDFVEIFVAFFEK